MKSDIKSDNLTLIKSLLQSIPQALMAISEAGHVIYLNSAALSQLGAELDSNPEELYSRRFGIVQRDGSVSSWESDPIKRATEGDTITIKAFLKNKQKNCPVNLTASPLQADSNIIGALISIKPAEEVESPDFSLFRKMFDLMPQLGWTAHADGFIDWYNKGWFDYTGTTLEQMQGWGWEAVHDQNYLPKVIERWKDSLRSELPFEMKFPLKGKDGKFRWFLTRINPILNDEGKLVRWVGINTDIDDEMVEMRQLSQLAEALPNAVWTTDAEGLCSYLSPRWKDLTGREPEDCLGTAWLELLHPNDREHAWSTWQMALESKSNYQTEFRLRQPNGEYLWVLALGLPLTNQSGEIVKWLGSLTDIQEKKLHESKLAQLIAERTAQLESARDHAITAQTIAETALEAKSRFLSTMSHEVRTPMTGIIGLTELLTMKDLGSENNEVVAAIFDSAKRLLQLLNNILEAAKLETGKVTLERRVFPLRTVLGDVRQLIVPEADKKRLTIMGKYEANLPEYVCGDELRVRQVLLNLAFNAVKFTNTGSIDISASLKRKDKNFTVVLFEVTDTGIGLSANQISKLFQRFEQADLEAASTVGGSGLGLSICKELVKLMNGEIGVRSIPGEGSTFWFEIPFAEDACAV